MSEPSLTSPQTVEPASLYVEVALPVPLFKNFEYSLDSESLLTSEELIGCRVRVPFGRNKLLGVIVDVNQSPSMSVEQIKRVEAVIDSAPIFCKKLMDLSAWLSDFYHSPIGEVLSAAMPTALRKGLSAELNKQAYLVVNTSRYPIGSELFQTAIDALNKSQSQLRLMNQIIVEPVSLKEARSKYSKSVIDALLSKGLICINEVSPATNTWHSKLSIADHLVATPEQAIAISAVNQVNHHQVFLLEGVTGSGKTEVYLQIIEKALTNKQQVLVLVPEIGLTPQTLTRFERRFGNIVAAMHSSMNNSERLSVWQKVKYQQIGIVIGTRSSIFLPFSNLGLMIVDEEHDESFKQQDGIRYHARDLAVYRARQEGIPLVLGSATPSVESLYNAISKKYTHLRMDARAGNAQMPSQHLLDLRGQSLQAGIAPAMLQRIEMHLQQGNQVIIFVSRRGYAPALICKACGYVDECEACQTPYTVHQSSRNLQCHRCGHTKGQVRSCRRCNSDNITTQGVGTEQVQEFLASRFPNYSCIRIDSDSVRGKQKLDSVLDEVKKQRHQILVGTQILSKGHHFPNVTLGLILNVDSYLFTSDYKAPEKLAQLVTQLSGRTGRASQKGEMWMQTYQIGHPLLQDLVNNGYQHFSRSVLQERRQLNLPPFSYHLALRVECKDQTVALEFLEYCRSLFSQFKRLQCFGPFPAHVEKKQTRFRFLLLVQSDSTRYLTRASTQARNDFVHHPLVNKLRWAIDMMPSDFS